MKNESDKEKVWKNIVEKLELDKHNFQKAPFYVSHKTIKSIVSSINVSSQTTKEIRVLGYQEKREKRPQYFIDNNLFLLPRSNKEWIFIHGDGYFDIPQKNEIALKNYHFKPNFNLETLKIGNSEMQYIDYAFATGIIQDFTNQKQLYLTIRGRKWIEEEIAFQAYGHTLKVNGVQTEVDAGYESKDEIILIEAKNKDVNNEIIRQIYFPFRKWQKTTKKKVRNIFLVSSKQDNSLTLYEYDFKDENLYESISLKQAYKYKINL